MTVDNIASAENKHQSSVEMKRGAWEKHTRDLSEIVRSRTLRKDSSPKKEMEKHEDSVV